MHRLTLLLVVVTASACADSGDEGFFIRNNIKAGEGCAVTPGGAFLSRGTMALGASTPYTLTPEIVSRITATQDNQNQRTVALRGARVELSVEGMTVNGESAAPPSLTNSKFTSLFSASLSPEGATTASFDAVSTAAINELSEKAPAGRVQIQLLAKVIVYGNLGGGDDEMEGVPFYYPITACNDCVVNVVGSCPLPFGTVPRAGNDCNVFQDGVVDCCVDADGFAICPAIVSTTPPA